MLEHDEIALTLLVLHETLEPGAECVEEVPSTNCGLITAEETNPAEAADDAGLL